MKVKLVSESGRVIQYEHVSEAIVESKYETNKVEEIMGGIFTTPIGRGYKESAKGASANGHE